MPPKDQDEPFKVTDLNLWRTHRKGIRFILSWLGISVCAIFLFYFGVNMNIISRDCWYITYINKQNLTEGTLVMLNDANTTSNIHYSLQSSVNVSYDYRLVCVLGITCFSLAGFISCAQILKPLYILIAIVMPYTITAFVWWYVWSHDKIFSVAA